MTRLKRWTTDKRFSIEPQRLRSRPGQTLPEQYCPEGSPLSVVALSMPTSLLIEERPNGTYYHSSGSIGDALGVRRLLPSGCLGKTRSNPRQGESEYPARQLKSLAESLLKFEKNKILALAWTSSEALQPKLSQEHWLALRQALAEVYDRISVERVVKLLQIDSEREADEIQLQVDEVFAQVHRAISETLSQTDDTGTLCPPFY